MNPDFRIFNHIQTLAETVKHDLISVLRNPTSPTQAFNIALAGGSTPRTIYEQWAMIQDDSLWSKVHFFWGDERCVPPDHDESNYKMAYDSFLSRIDVEEDQIHRIHGEENPEAEVQRYAHEIKSHLQISNNTPKFDWILLGMGTDGHTASLFPNSPAVKEQQLYCVIAQHPQTGQKRISLTLPVINNAKKITFLVTGEDKAQIISEIFSHTGEFTVAKKNKLSNYPAAQVKPQSGILQWYLDEAASSLL
ncbi:MAG: 6-phosphogluconolactonase [Aliifodinibius sp.]|nr:6-phosphogluconolactonase [Fodinibius sp.]